jgi:hypothetical protein
MSFAVEVAQALYGAWRFARLDRHALQYFDLSHRGVWRSFWAAAICYPGFFVLLLLRLDDDTVAQSGLIRITIIETIGYVIAWSGFTLLVLGFCRWIGREDRGFDFIVAYNWSSVLQTLLFVIVSTFADLALSQKLGIDLIFAANIAVLGYEWFIALVAIGAGGWIAAAVVFMDVAIGTIVPAIATNLY